MPPLKGKMKLFPMSLMIDWQSKEIIIAFAKKRRLRTGALLRHMVLKSLDDMFLDMGDEHNEQGS